MFTLTTHYDQLYQHSVEKIKTNNFTIDPLLDNPGDDRLGITLLCRPDNKVKTQITSFLDKMHQLEPAQYFYPKSDMHITIMSIISCYSGFKPNLVNTRDYTEIVAKSLKGIAPFSITFDGITASDSCIMIQGFADDTLLHIRNNLRHFFLTSGVSQSLDSRYTIKTAHSTVIRFRKKSSNVKKFLQTLHTYRHFPFGNFTVNEVELVFNDWYQRFDKVRLIHKFKLGN